MNGLYKYISHYWMPGTDGLIEAEAQKFSFPKMTADRNPDTVTNFGRGTRSWIPSRIGDSARKGLGDYQCRRPTEAAA
jgi:hypothetical protein